MELKVAKNPANCRLLSISLLDNSVIIKQLLQQQILASIVLAGRSLAVNDLPDNPEITLEMIPLHRLSDETGILYRSAIALKLAPLWQLPALEIANQLVESITKINQQIANSGSREAKEREGENSSTQIPDEQQGRFSPLVKGGWGGSPGLQTHPSQDCLDLSIEVVFPGWIDLRPSDRALATWLQRLIHISPLLSGLEDDLSIGFPKKGESKQKNQYTQKSETTAHQLFEVQYTHARCCSLLRLAHRQGLIELSDPDFQTQSWHFVAPNPIPWLYGEEERESEPMHLRLKHPAERSLIEGILEGIDQLSHPTPSSTLKLATTLSHRFEQFYSACRIWGEVKTQTHSLAQARLGLVGVTQILLRFLLTYQLGVTAPVEL